MSRRNERGGGRSRFGEDGGLNWAPLPVRGGGRRPSPKGVFMGDDDAVDDYYTNKSGSLSRSRKAPKAPKATKANTRNTRPISKARLSNQTSLLFSSLQPGQASAARASYLASAAAGGASSHGKDDDDDDNDADADTVTDTDTGGRGQSAPGTEAGAGAEIDTHWPALGAPPAIRRSNPGFPTRAGGGRSESGGGRSGRSGSGRSAGGAGGGGARSGSGGGGGGVRVRVGLQVNTSCGSYGEGPIRGGAAGRYQH